MRKNFSLILFIALSAFAKISHAQDTICTRDKVCFAVEIVTVKNKIIYYRKAADETKALQSMYFPQVSSIRYADGRIRYFETFIRQAAVGAAFYTDISPARQFDVDKYSNGGSSTFYSAGMLLRLIYRGNVMGIAINAGYSHTASGGEISYQNTYGQNSFTSKHWESVSNNIPLLISPRFNLRKQNVNPFFEFTVGTEFFLSGSFSQSGTNHQFSEYKNPLIFKTGFGIQSDIAKKWITEFSMGIATREDFVSPENNQYVIANLNLTICRALYSKVSH